MSKNQGCSFCRADENGGISFFDMQAQKNNIFRVRNAEMYFEDGHATVILRTPTLPQDQRMRVKINFCPMCGRKYDEETAGGYAESGSEQTKEGT